MLWITADATCDPHGTHVSGIVGALANNYGLSGVAPQASLGMFRVRPQFSRAASTRADALPHSFLAAPAARPTTSCAPHQLIVAKPAHAERADPPSLGKGDAGGV